MGDKGTRHTNVRLTRLAQELLTHSLLPAPSSSLLPPLTRCQISTPTPFRAFYPSCCCVVPCCGSLFSPSFGWLSVISSVFPFHCLLFVSSGRAAQSPTRTEAEAVRAGRACACPRVRVSLVEESPAGSHVRPESSVRHVAGSF